MSKFLTIVVLDDKGTEIARDTASAKQFSSGSIGYYMGTKIDVGGLRHQVGMNIIQIGSKGMMNVTKAVQVQSKNDASTAPVNSDNLTQAQVAQYIVSEFKLELPKAMEYALDARMIQSAKEWYALQKQNAPIDVVGEMLKAKGHVPTVPSNPTPKKASVRKSKTELQTSVPSPKTVVTPSNGTPVKIALVVNGKTVTFQQDKLNKKNAVETIASSFNTQIMQSKNGHTHTVDFEADSNAVGISHRFDAWEKSGFITVTQ